MNENTIKINVCLVEKQENLGHMIQNANYYVFIEKKSNECKYSLLFFEKSVGSEQYLNS